MRCWRGYLSGAGCRLFAYCLAVLMSVTVIPKPRRRLPHLLVSGFTVLVLVYPGCPGKEAIKRLWY